MRETGDRGVGIRRAGPQDAVALMTLRASWRDAAVTEDFALTFAAWFEREGDQRWWWLAEDSTGVAVGMANVKVFDRMPVPDRDAGRWGYLGNLFVQPTHRNWGVGTRLLAALLATSQQEGLVRIVLSPSEQSVPLYKRAGFVSADMLLVWRAAS